MVIPTGDEDTIQDRQIIAILPAFNYYKKLSLEADIFAVRFPCQIDSKIRNNFNLVLFDEYISKEIGQRYNQKAVYESLHHSIGENGDVSCYKGVSLVDVDHAAIYCSVFLHCYREALSFLTLVNDLKPTKVILEDNDPNLDIFSELASQINLKIENVNSFGLVDVEKSKLIKKSNRALDIQDYHWYRWLKQPVWKRVTIKMLNCWSRLVRIIKGYKPFIYIVHHGQLSGIRAQLSKRKEYYPIFFSLIKLPLFNLFTSGLYILQKQDAVCSNRKVPRIIRDYKRYLKTEKNIKDVGQIKFKDINYSITYSIIGRLTRHISYSFCRLIENIDILDNFIKRHKIAGSLLSSDLNWDRRIVVKMFQKHKLKSMVLINGWFGTKHMIENKTVDKILCFGKSYVSNYFKEKEDVKVVGSSVFDAAYKKRELTKPKYPVKRILISTFTFSPADINCRYNDTEKYLNDVLTVIDKYRKENSCKIQVDLRPHPSEDVAFYSWYLKKMGFPEIEIKSTGSLQETVAYYDLYFASYSTTLFETAVMGIPVIFYHPSNQILYPPFDGKCNDLPSAFSDKELDDVFVKLMTDKEYAYKFTDVSVLKPYVGNLDGHSTKRIIDETIKMVGSCN